MNSLQSPLFPIEFQAKETGENSIFLDSQVISSLSPWKNRFVPTTEVQLKLLKVMQGASTLSLGLPLLLSAAKAVVWKKNSALLTEAKELVQSLLKDLFQQAKEQSNHSFHYEVIIGELLALLPFLDPEANGSLQVPMQIKNEWRMVDYEIEKLEVSYQEGLSPYVFYGLKAKNSCAPPLLLFKGTTYCTDDGFLVSLLADLDPTVGGQLFEKGKKQMDTWLIKETNQGQNRALVYGKSLGGALARRAALHFPGYVSKMMAYGAPGFSPECATITQKNDHPLPEFHFFTQTNDLVPFWGEIVDHHNMRYYQVSSPTGKKFIRAHADMYSIHDSHHITQEIEVGKQNTKKRKFFNWLCMRVSYVASLLLWTITKLYLGSKKAIAQLGKIFCCYKSKSSCC